MSAYNGWTNYETWSVKLWIDNDEGSTLFWAEEAQTAWDDAEDSEPLYSSDDQMSRATRALAEQLKEHHEERADELGLFDGSKVGFISDLFSSALGEVNWHEIAKSLLEEVTTNA